MLEALQKKISDLKQVREEGLCRELQPNLNQHSSVTATEMQPQDKRTNIPLL